MKAVAQTKLDTCLRELRLLNPERGCERRYLQIESQRHRV